MKRLAYSLMTLLLAASAEADDSANSLLNPQPLGAPKKFEPANTSDPRRFQAPSSAEKRGEASLDPAGTRPALPQTPDPAGTRPAPQPTPGPSAQERLDNAFSSAPPASRPSMGQNPDRTGRRMVMPSEVPQPKPGALITAPTLKTAPRTSAPVTEDNLDEALKSGPITLYAAGNYRLRRGPWEKIQLIIPKGESFELVRKFDAGKKGVWYEVRYHGKTGYVFASGITHPLAGAVQAKAGISNLRGDEAALIAACVTNVQDAHMVPGLQDFIEAVHDKLTTSTRAPSVHPDPAEKRGGAESAKPMPAPPGRPADVSVREPAKKGGAENPKAAPAVDLGKKGRVANAAKNQRLAEACWQAATKYRNFAPHVCRRMRVNYPCGGSDNPYKSKGWCGAGAKECIRQATGIDLAGAGDSFVSKRNTLNKKATRLAVNSCDEAPAGAVCIYTASYHSYGHIEAKILKTNPKTGKQVYMYCSDYCSSSPVRRNHTFQGAYLP